MPAYHRSGQDGQPQSGGGMPRHGPWTESRGPWRLWHRRSFPPPHGCRLVLSRGQVHEGVPADAEGFCGKKDFRKTRWVPIGHRAHGDGRKRRIGVRRLAACRREGGLGECHRNHRSPGPAKLSNASPSVVPVASITISALVASSGLTSFLPAHPPASTGRIRFDGAPPVPVRPATAGVRPG